MQFVIIARDGTDAQSQQRRHNARAAHIENTERHMLHMVMGAATLDECENMNGSVMIVEFPSREDLDQWLRSEPYVVQGVWKEIEVLSCRIGPSFVDRAARRD